MVVTALRVLALGIGLLAYYTAFFMYEDEQGKWQNRVENLWVVIHDRARESGSKSAALFASVAAIVTKAFETLFGRNILSARFVGTSISCSFAVGFLLLSLTLPLARSLGLYADQPSPKDLIAFRDVEIVLIIAGLIFSFFAILPTLWRSRWAVALTLSPVVLMLLGVFHALTPKRLAFFVGLALSLLSDVLLLVLARFTVRWVSANGSVWRTASALLIQFSIVFFLILVPSGIPEAFPEFRQSVILMALVDMGGLNIFTALASSAFFLLLLSLLLHRGLWPVLARILYPLARFQVIRNPKITFFVGSGCLLFALPSLSGPVRSLIEWLAKRGVGG